MKFTALECPNCGANLDRQANFCSRCGSKLQFEDGSTTQNLNFTYRIVDEAKLKQADAEERIQMKLLEFEKQLREKEQGLKRKTSLLDSINKGEYPVGKLIMAAIVAITYLIMMYMLIKQL